MAAFGVALVALLAPLTMGQNWINLIRSGRFGVGPGIGRFRPGFGGGAAFGLGTSAIGLNQINPFFSKYFLLVFH